MALLPSGRGSRGVPLVSDQPRQITRAEPCSSEHIIAHSIDSDNSKSIVLPFPIRASYGRMKAAGGARLWGGQDTLRFAVKPGGVLSRWAGRSTEGFDRALGVSSVERSAEVLTPWARRGHVEASSKGGTYVV